MDTSVTPQPLPRLRVSRASPSGRRDNETASVASSSQAGPSRLTDFTQLVDLHLSDIRAAHAYTDEDEEEDQYPTPRMNPTTTLAPSSVTPAPSLAGRLRELIQLVPNGSAPKATPTVHRPPSPTFHESDFEGDSTAGGHTRTRESIRDIFSKALREPGDTPQKGRPRRNSVSSASESDVLPASSRNQSDVKGKRKSSSDEESVNSLSHDPRHPDPKQHAILRSSRETSAVDFPLKSISAEDSDDGTGPPDFRPPDSHNGLSTAVQSLRISQSSNFPQHSDLLDQDSEMQHAFEGVESSDEPSNRSRKPHETRARDGIASKSPSTTPGSKKLTTPQTVRPAKKVPEPSRSHENQFTSTEKPMPRQPTRGVNDKGRHTGHRRTSLQGTVSPALKHRSSASLQFSDRSSAMSVSDYAERAQETEQERNHEREREWNKPHHKNTRPGSSLSFNFPRPEHRSRTSSISSLESPRPGSALSNMSIDSGESPRTRTRTPSGLSERHRTMSGDSRPASALSNDSMSVTDFPQGLRRHHSLTNRPQSPVLSRGTGNQVEEVVIEHERERNWNAPRPKWHRRSLPNTPDRPTSPGPSKLSTTPQSPADRHRQSTTPSTAPKDASNATRSGSSLARRHSQPKVALHSPSPVERRNAVSATNTKSPHSRLPNVTTSSPSHSRSPLHEQASQHKSRLPVPSARAHGSREELSRLVPDIHIQDEVGETQIQPFPQGVNGQSQFQESMELTEAYNGHVTSSAIPSFSDAGEPFPTPNNDTMHTASLLAPDDSQDAMYQTYGEDEEDFLVQERTPTIQTIEPPPEENQDHAPETSSPTDQGIRNPTNPREDEDFEPTPPDFQLPDANRSSSVPSFLSTPPRSRHSSFNSSKPEFKTPSPPKGGLPDLPEPPSGDETEDDPLPQFNITPMHIDTSPADGSRNGRGDITTFKTPKPPGAWLATPGTSFLPPNHDDSAQAYIDSSDDGLLRAKAQSQSSFPQAHAAPGGWAFTPATRQRPHSDPKTTLNEGGLTTPVASIGRANTLLPKTPAPPGGWVNTPGVAASSRKSVLKVRFDPDVTSAANGSSDMLSDSSVYPTNGSSAPSRERPVTPEPVMPATPPSRSPGKHKRSPSVRLVDAYGNERGQNPGREVSSPTPSTPKSGIRIVDALGQEVKEEPEEFSEGLHELHEGSGEDVPMTRMEALQRVRQGIQELAEGIESLDWSSQSRDDTSRIRELDETSRALKQSREQLAHDMHKAEKQLRHQVQQKIRASSFLGRNGWFLLCVALVQIVLIFMMYRASVLRARKLFLTNYYDPFNPDLFLYTTNPDTQYTATTMSWRLVVQAVRSGDIKAFMWAFRSNISILIKRWHQQIWDVWGDDPTRPVGAWPPT